MMIANAEAARLLTDTTQLRLLEPLFKLEAVLSEVAAELGVKLNTLLYRVNKFVELGLLAVVREEPRRGKAVKVYRATAEEFFVPFDVMGSLSLEQLLLGLLGDVEKVFHREAAKTFQETLQTKGVHVALNEGHMSVVLGDRERGTAFTEAFFGPGSPALFIGDGNLELDFATAKALQKDLFELFERYSTQQTPGAQRYAYRLGMTPLTDESPVKV
ncbi:helix-turn-helix domain-containing protein [soil metagenome]